MAARTSQQSYAAFFEDFDEDANVTIPETRTVANVAAKRSKADPQQSGTSTDGASDSGYSSRTAATVGSADSLPTGKRSPPFVQLDAVIANRDIERVRGRPDDREREKSKSKGKDRQSKETNSSTSNGTTSTIHVPNMRRSSSRPAPKRSSSKARKWESTHGRHAPDTCPDCDQYGYHNVSMGAHPLPDPHPVDYGSYMHPQSHGYDIPPSPHPQSYHYPPVATQEIVSSRRDRSNSYHQSRPMSYHAGAMPDMNMYMHMTPSTPAYEQQHGPPISASAYAHYMAPYNMPNGPVAPPHPSHMSYESAPPPPFERPRAASTSRSPEKPTGRRGSMYGTPVVEYPSSPGSASQRWIAATAFLTGSSCFPIFTACLPPHSPKANPRLRSSFPLVDHLPAKRPLQHPLRPCHDAQKASIWMTFVQPFLQPESAGKCPEKPSCPSDDPARLGKQASEPPPTTILGERPASRLRTARRRRSSVYGVEQTKDLDQKQREAEEYQSARTSRATPLTLDSLVKCRRSHRADSDSGSLRTRTDSSRGSDAKTKSAISRPEDDEITVMIGGLRIGVSKDHIDRQVINLRSGEEGSLELNIEGRRPKRYFLSRSESLSGTGGGAVRREIEESRRLRHDSSSDRASRRSSRSGYSGRGLLES
ncbi:predicted protein [Histoplasma mississippiense (nom. inval.)]|uniref:predicted protein n=1 Tax=Ajellomyces capsulatus (strain NAm1 / WU24) TaxID=2059318 RepID=UPI000157C158|nr:predicted protein [Histoplasma mississippiense (nom. inval.)]EDN07337.1 predicted protein [Histoplasma mississippiense (nom. inval.)]